MDQAERRILVVTCFGHFISHFNMLVFPALVLPLTGRLGLSVPKVLELSFWMYMLFGLTALPWGLLTDRFGPRRLLVLFFAGAGVCGLWASMNLDNPTGLAFALAGVGLFSGIYHPAGLGLISKGVRRVAMGMGYNGMFGNLGLAAAPLVTGVINWLGGPVAAYVFMGALNLAGAGLMLVLPLKASKGSEESDGDKAAGGARSWLPFVVLLGAMMLGGIAYRGSSVILPTLFELRAHQIYDFLHQLWPGTPTANLVATALTSLIYMFGVFAQWVGGRVGERYRLLPLYLVFHGLSLPAAFLAGWATGLPLFGLVAFYLFFLLGMQPIENTLVGRITPASFRHSAFGVKFVFTFGVGSASVWMISQVQTHVGLGAVMPFLGVVSACLVGVVLILMRVTRGQKL